MSPNEADSPMNALQLSMIDAGPGYYSVMASGPGWGCGHCRFYDSELLAREAATRFAGNRVDDPTTKLSAMLMDDDPPFASRLDWTWDAALRGERVVVDDHGRARHYGHT
jgi:hypothetical protein